MSTAIMHTGAFYDFGDFTLKVSVFGLGCWARSSPRRGRVLGTWETAHEQNLNCNLLIGMEVLVLVLGAAFRSLVEVLPEF